jgi:hypothetical protein
MGKFPVFLPDTKGAFAIPTPPEYPKLHTLCLAVAKRGAGKSTAVCSLIRDFKRAQLLDRVFVLSPTCGSNKALYATTEVAEDDAYDNPNEKAIASVLKKVDEEREEWEEYLRKKEKWDALRRLISDPNVDLERVPAELLEGVEDLERPPVSKYGHAPRLAMLVDDCQGTKLFTTGSNNPFGHLCIKHRHVGQGLGISIFILCQNFSAPGACNRFIRQNATHLMLFRERDAEVMEKIAAEASGVHWSSEEFLRAYNYAVRDAQHDFLFVEYNPPRLRRCFDEILTDAHGRLLPLPHDAATPDEPAAANDHGVQAPAHGRGRGDAQGAAQVGAGGRGGPVPARPGLLQEGHAPGRGAAAQGEGGAGSRRRSRH